VSTRPGSPYAAIGIVYTSTSGPIVTGFLISDCSVMTVRHDVANQVGHRVHFQAGEIGRSSNWEDSAGEVVAVGNAPSVDQSTQVGPGDWAIIKLDRCLGRRFGHVVLDPHPLGANEQVAMAGYPSDRNLEDGLFLDPSCAVRGASAGMTLHDCAMQPGNSGSPVFRPLTGNAKKLTVVAMNSGGWSYGVPGATLRLPIKGYSDAYANRAVAMQQIAAHSLSNVSKTV
jgi:V8-like Glu-specific endopeptidase